MEEKKPLILEGEFTQFPKSNTGGQNFVGGHASGESWVDPEKVEQKELTAEEQQAILKKILQESKSRAAISLFKKLPASVRKDAAKKKKAKKRMQNKTRNKNRK
jgi:hypothetical protein